MAEAVHRSCDRKGLGKLARMHSDEGQMAVELMVVLPGLLVVAIILVNACTFFTHCAEFDRLARNAVRVEAASPAAGNTLEDARGSILSLLNESFDGDGIHCDVDLSMTSGLLARFNMTLFYRPSLFSFPLKDSLFGVVLPELKHRVSLVVDVYKPGMLF